MNASEVKKLIAQAVKESAACWDGDLSKAGKVDRKKAGAVGDRLYEALAPALRLEGPDLGADPQRTVLDPAGCELTVRFPSGDVSPPLRATRLETVAVAPGVRVLVLAESPEAEPALELLVGLLPKP